MLSVEHRKKISEAQKGEKNYFFGKKHTEESRKKMSEHKKGKNHGVVGENHYAWKGDKVGYKSLHRWVRIHSPQPESCEFCDIRPSKDLANITGVYNRELENWKYLCRRCHIWYDCIRRA